MTTHQSVKTFQFPKRKNNNPDIDFQLCKTRETHRLVIVYLVSLVWFGHPALWDHLHCIHFVVGQVCHLIASSKAALWGETNRMINLHKQQV